MRGRGTITFTIGTTLAPTGNDSYTVSYTVSNGVVDGSTHEYYKDHTPAGGTLTTDTSGTVTINTTTPSPYNNGKYKFRISISIGKWAN